MTPIPRLGSHVSHEILLGKLKIYGFCDMSLKWMESYLRNRKQIVEIASKTSSYQEINIGTPQGSRLSPFLFIILMADLNLWTEESILSNFVDDTQSVIIGDIRKNLLETTIKETNYVIDFFASNNMVNNSEKAAVLYDSRGKGEFVTVENIGGEILKSISSEKLLGLHINFNFEWSTHADKISIELKKRISLLRRIRNTVPKIKLITIAEVVFNSKIRYGAAVFLNPVYDEEELKLKKLPTITSVLQTL